MEMSLADLSYEQHVKHVMLVIMAVITSNATKWLIMQKRKKIVVYHLFCGESSGNKGSQHIGCLPGLISYY